jgi:drug/metabolite transporter (DMT)-like permease
MSLGFIFAIGASITWGLAYTLDQKILTNVSPITFLFLNSLLTALIALPFIFFNQSGIHAALSSGKNNLLLIIAAVMLAFLANFFILSSIKALDASTASMIEIAYPFFVVFFSYLLFRSVPNIYFLLGGALIFIGSVIIIKFAS